MGIGPLGLARRGARPIASAGYRLKKVTVPERFITSPSGNPSTSPSRAKSAREWLIVGATGSVAVLGAWWYLQIRPSSRVAQHIDSDKRSHYYGASRSFSIPVRTQDSQMVSKVISSLSPSEVDGRLRENEQCTNVERPQGSCIVQRYDTNSLSSNDPIEDRRAEVIVERDAALQGSEQKGDLGFFAVMDGHAGYHTSSLLSQKVSLFLLHEEKQRWFTYPFSLAHCFCRIGARQGYP